MLPYSNAITPGPYLYEWEIFYITISYRIDFRQLNIILLEQMCVTLSIGFCSIRVSVVRYIIIIYNVLSRWRYFDIRLTRVERRKFADWLHFSHPQCKYSVKRKKNYSAALPRLGYEAEKRKTINIFFLKTHINPIQFRVRKTLISVNSINSFHYWYKWGVMRNVRIHLISGTFSEQRFR